MNLYGIVGNDPVVSFDALGLKEGIEWVEFKYSLGTSGWFGLKYTTGGYHGSVETHLKGRPTKDSDRWDTDSRGPGSYSNDNQEYKAHIYTHTVPGQSSASLKLGGYLRLISNPIITPLPIEGVVYGPIDNVQYSHFLTGTLAVKGCCNNGATATFNYSIFWVRKHSPTTPTASGKGGLHFRIAGTNLHKNMAAQFVNHTDTFSKDFDLPEKGSVQEWSYNSTLSFFTYSAGDSSKGIVTVSVDVKCK